MLKMLLCCGGGFSSSYDAVRMQDEIRERHLEAEYQIDFSPFSLINEVVDKYDVILLCPHLKMELFLYLKKNEIEKPVYLLPPRVYGMMTLDAIIQDSKDVISIYRETKEVPVTFPGEENLMRIKRNTSYRSIYGDYHDYKNKSV